MLNKIKKFLNEHLEEVAAGVVAVGILVVGIVVLKNAIETANAQAEPLYNVTLHDTTGGPDQHLVVTERLLHEMEVHQAAAEAGITPPPWRN